MANPDRHRKERALCPVCGTLFQKRARQQVPYTCSASCGQTLLFRAKSGTGSGRILHPSGYIKVYAPNHPFTTANGYVMEHRVVMEQVLGRFLMPYERVHHKNGDRTDNTPENLELWTLKFGRRNQPNGVRVEDQLAQLIHQNPELAEKIMAERTGEKA